MADITDQHDQTSPTDLDDAHSVGNGNNANNENRGVKRQRPAADDDEDDDEKGGRERRKIEIKFISDKSRRHITFSKRKAGIMKKVRADASRAEALLPASTTEKKSCSQAVLLWSTRARATDDESEELGVNSGLPLDPGFICTRAPQLTMCLVSALGIRVICPDRHSSSPAGRLRDGPCLYLHHSQAPAARYQGRGQEFDPGMQPAASHAESFFFFPFVHILPALGKLDVVR